MNTNKRPLLVMITLVLLFLSTFYEAKAQCVIAGKPNPIVIDYSGNCTYNLRPTDFSHSLPAATATAQYNITIVGVALNLRNRQGLTTNTDTFPRVNPVAVACDTLNYILIREDLNANPTTCTLSGQIVFRDVRVPTMSVGSNITFSTSTGYAIKPSDLNYTINNTPNCPLGIQKVQIKRASEPDSRFRDTILLSCADGIMLPVVLKATNACGITQCVSTTLTIQDKIGPDFMVGSLPDITVNCPAIKDVKYYDDPVFTDWCGYTIFSREIVDDLVTNTCGTGTFTLKYIAKDKFGNPSAPYLRKVTVINPFPFNSNTIVWPKDTIINNPLITNPSQVPTSLTGVPTWINNGCELIATSLTEMVVRVSPTACSFKIIRKWSVANCCLMGVHGSLDDPYTHTQTIVVMDNLGPTLTNLPMDQTVSCDNNCIKDVLNLQRPGATDCGNAVFPNSAFTVTFTPNPAGMVQDPTNPFNFTKVPVGVYKVTYIVKDESNNISFHSFQLTVADRTIPSLVVFDRLAVPVGSGGTVMVNITSFIERVSDNCTAVSDLTFSFSPTKDSTFVTYGCKDVRLCTPSMAYKEVTIFVKDKAGNVQAVIARVDVQKGMSPCSCSKSVAGAIETSGGSKVEDVVVTLDQNNTKKSTKTSNSGYFEFTTNTPASFTILPDKNDDVLNGVSTLDLVLISKHILGTQKFTSPYQHIAADIDKSGKISSADIVQLRKTLLGINPSFGSNTSWRFIDKAYQFADPLNPDLNKLPEGKSGTATSNNDFVGIKVGDLNGNAKANRSATPSGFRGTLPSLVFEAKNVSFLNKQEFSVPVCVPDFGDVIAYQFTMKFDATKLQLTSITNGDNAADVEYGTTHLDEGMATTSWMNISAMPMKKGERVFTLHFKSIGKGELSRCLQFSSDLTKAEAYNDAGDIGAISLNINNIRKENTKIKNSVLSTLQNAPNPFMESTTVQFYLDETTDATLTIFDQTGKLLKKIEGNYSSGMNNVELSDLPAGLMFYRLETPDGYSDTKRMLKLD